MVERPAIEPTEPIGACRFHGKQMPFDCTQ